MVSPGRSEDLGLIVHFKQLFYIFSRFFPSLSRGEEPSVRGQLQRSALHAPVRLQQKDLLFLHLGRTHRRTALVLNDLRLREGSSVLLLH